MSQKSFYAILASNYTSGFHVTFNRLATFKKTFRVGYVTESRILKRREDSLCLTVTQNSNIDGLILLNADA